MKFLRDTRQFIGIVVKKRNAVYEIAKRDFQSQNKNTYLGTVWGFIQPLIYVLLLIFVFNVGLRSNPGGDIPFAVYLICGMIPWQFFAVLFASLTGVVNSHSFLVKKGDFSLGVLHIAKILGSVLPHLVLCIITILFCWYYHIGPDFYLLQLLYYFVAMALLLIGLGWITSSTSIFVPDVSNIVQLIVQFGFWFTPIIWNLDMIPQKYRWVLKLNPVCYIISGYRDSLIYKIPFWDKPLETLYFWVFTLVVLLIGATVFRKLKPHFGEVI